MANYFEIAANNSTMITGLFYPVTTHEFQGLDTAPADRYIWRPLKPSRKSFAL